MAADRPSYSWARVEKHAQQFAGQAAQGGDADRGFVRLGHVAHLLGRQRESAGRIVPADSRCVVEVRA